MRFGVVTSVFISVGLAAGSSAARAEAPPDRVKAQIAGAVLAAPEEMREGAAVYAYDEKGELFLARKGANELVCLASDPTETSFKASCYHRDLEPFMARGRELRREGVDRDELQARRYREIESGELSMARGPRTLHVLTGRSFDAKRGTVEAPHRRWVIYIPFATPESIGLSSKPHPHDPWLMFPGTAGAHIMITPPKPKTDAE